MNCDVRLSTGEGSAFPPDDLAPDVLRGGAAIAAYLYGAAARRRKVYYLVEKSRLPVFRMGSTLCARRSVLLQWIADQEKRNGDRARP